MIITHNISVAEYLSDILVVMYAGNVVEYGPSGSVISKPRHPYTITLIASAPVPNPWKRNLLNTEIKGEVPSSINPPSGCKFHPRCPYAEKVCSEQVPEIEGNLSRAICLLPFCRKDWLILFQVNPFADYAALPSQQSRFRRVIIITEPTWRKRDIFVQAGCRRKIRPKTEVIGKTIVVVIAPSRFRLWMLKNAVPLKTKTPKMKM